MGIFTIFPPPFSQHNKKNVKMMWCAVIFTMVLTFSILTFEQAAELFRMCNSFVCSTLNVTPQKWRLQSTRCIQLSKTMNKCVVQTKKCLAAEHIQRLYQIKEQNNIEIDVNFLIKVGLWCVHTSIGADLLINIFPN